MWKKLPTPWKILFPTIIIFLLGFSIYNYIDSNPLVKIIIFSPICLIISFILYKITKQLSDTWGIFLGISIVFLFWMYIFMNDYRNYIIDEKHGLKRLICNPHGICKTDKTEGPFNGAKQTYKFQLQDETFYIPTCIPSDSLKNDNTGQYTYMFWLKLDYTSWKKYKNNYTNSDGPTKIPVIKNNLINETPPFVCIDKDVNKIIITVKDVSNVYTVPFNKWVHFSVVIDQNICNIYKNAVLENAFTIYHIVEKNSDLCIGGTPVETGDNTDEYSLDGFPGFLVYLYYYNDALSLSSIYKTYKNQYLSITGIRDDPDNKQLIQDECDC